METKHNLAIGYLAWLFGFFGLHRFYYGKTASGVLYLFTFGLLGIGWVVDVVLIPAMQDEAERRFVGGDVDYSITWALWLFGGVFGLHRFYMGDPLWGLIYLFTGGLLLLGWFYDCLTLNEQISRLNYFSNGRGNFAHGHHRPHWA